MVLCDTDCPIFLKGNAFEADALELLGKTSNSNLIALFPIVIPVGSTNCHFQSPVLSITLQTVESLLRHIEGTDGHIPGIGLPHGDPCQRRLDVTSISALLGSIILPEGLAQWLWMVEDATEGVLVQPG